MFLFCSPDIDTLFELAAPQPFVLIYQRALGDQGQVVMTTIAIIGLLIVSDILYLSSTVTDDRCVEHVHLHRRCISIGIRYRSRWNPAWKRLDRKGRSERTTQERRHLRRRSEFFPVAPQPSVLICAS